MLNGGAVEDGEGEVIRRNTGCTLQTVVQHYDIMLLLYLGEYGCEWAYECNAPPFRNDHKVLARDSYNVGFRKHSR